MVERAKDGMNRSKREVGRAFNTLTYVFSNLSRNRSRTGLTIFGIAVPIAFFILFAAMGQGLELYIAEQAENNQLNKNEYSEMADIVTSWTNILMIIIAIMIVVSVTNTILMSTSERKFEFGVLKAVGFTQDKILYLVLTEAFILSLFALIVGIIIGFWGAILFDYMFWLDEGSGFFFAPAKITFGSIMIVSILTLLIGTITALFPAINVSKASIIEILRCE